MKIFISGPITGYDNYNRQAFRDAEYRLGMEGHSVMSPANICQIHPEGYSDDDYMEVCYAMVRRNDAVYMLQGWQDSVGANKEIALARELGKTVIFENDEGDMKHEY